MTIEKSIFNFKIMNLDGSIVDLHDDLNLWVEYFRLSSLSPEHFTETMESADGSFDMGTRLEERKAFSSIIIEEDNAQDFDKKKKIIFKLFNPIHAFYIIRDLEPDKRIKVKVASSFDIDSITLEDGQFNIDFVIQSVFIESIGTTLSPVDGLLTQVCTNYGDPPIQYEFNNNQFQIWNDGDFEINPRRHFLVIKFIGASSNLKIENMTTGDEWTYSGETLNSDVIKIDGIRSTKNSLSIFRQTNRKLISLNQGWNQLKITGATDFTISFDFRFLYV